VHLISPQDEQKDPVLSICLLIVVCVRHLAQICVYRHVYEKVALQQSYLLKANVEINQVVLKSCRDVCVYALNTGSFCSSCG
jgi:hypothetical protein